MLSPEPDKALDGPSAVEGQLQADIDAATADLEKAISEAAVEAPAPVDVPLDLTTVLGTKLHGVTYTDGVLVLRRYSDSNVVLRQEIEPQDVVPFLKGFRAAFTLAV